MDETVLGVNNARTWPGQGEWREHWVVAENGSSQIQAFIWRFGNMVHVVFKNDFSGLVYVKGFSLWGQKKSLNRKDFHLTTSHQKEQWPKGLLSSSTWIYLRPNGRKPLAQSQLSHVEWVNECRYPFWYLLTEQIKKNPILKRKHSFYSAGKFVLYS